MCQSIYSFFYTIHELSSYSKGRDIKKKAEKCKVVRQSNRACPKNWSLHSEFPRSVFKGYKGGVKKFLVIFEIVLQNATKIN